MIETSPKHIIKRLVMFAQVCAGATNCVGFRRDFTTEITEKAFEKSLWTPRPLWWTIFLAHSFSHSRLRHLFTCVLVYLVYSFPRPNGKILV
jgi:hypothetical protein